MCYPRSSRFLGLTPFVHLGPCARTVASNPVQAQVVLFCFSLVSETVPDELVRDLLRPSSPETSRARAHGRRSERSGRDATRRRHGRLPQQPTRVFYDDFKLRFTATTTAAVLGPQYLSHVSVVRCPVRYDCNPRGPRLAWSVIKAHQFVGFSISRRPHSSRLNARGHVFVKSNSFTSFCYVQTRFR